MVHPLKGSKCLATKVWEIAAKMHPVKKIIYAIQHCIGRPHDELGYDES
jgi:hypothetical protein